MATPTFNWTVTTQTTPTIGYAVRAIKFGDGYEQTAGEGVNNRQESWSVTWVGSDVEMEAIMDMFDSLGGNRSFFWTNPLGKIGLYKCVDPAPSELGGDTFQISATFTKAYAA
jgi:phage-related protein